MSWSQSLLAYPLVYKKVMRKYTFDREMKR